MIITKKHLSRRTFLQSSFGAAIALRDRIRRAVPGRPPAPRFGAPLALAGAAVVYALAAFLVYKQYRIIFDIGYHLASLLFVYWLVGRVRRGGTTNTKPKPA